MAAPDRTDPLDPRGLIYEAYNIDGITEPDCRAIFFDWAMRDGGGAAEIEALLARHGDAGHPMTRVLTEGLSAADAPRRRGGRRGRGVTDQP